MHQEDKTILIGASIFFTAVIILAAMEMYFKYQMELVKHLNQIG
jgi:hypothetical protein